MYLPRAAGSQPGKIHLDGRKRLSEFVMYFPGNPGAFLFPNGLKMNGETPELFPGIRQFFFRSPLFGDVFVSNNYPLLLR